MPNDTASSSAKPVLEGIVGMPYQDPQAGHVWNQFTIRIADGHRDGLRRYLTEQQIGTEVYYPIPLHQQKCFESLGHSAAASRSQNKLPPKCFTFLSTGTDDRRARQSGANYRPVLSVELELSTLLFLSQRLQRRPNSGKEFPLPTVTSRIVDFGHFRAGLAKGRTSQLCHAKWT